MFRNYKSDLIKLQQEVDNKLFNVKNSGTEQGGRFSTKIEEDLNTLKGKISKAINEKSFTKNELITHRNKFNEINSDINKKLGAEPEKPTRK